jgi:hypothetical protein
MARSPKEFGDKDCRYRMQAVTHLRRLRTILEPCVLGSAHFVPEPGENIRLPLSKKKQAGFEMVGLLVNVPF